MSREATRGIMGWQGSAGRGRAGCRISTPRLLHPAIDGEMEVVEALGMLHSLQLGS